MFWYTKELLTAFVRFIASATVFHNDSSHPFLWKHVKGKATFLWLLLFSTSMQLMEKDPTDAG